MTIKVHSGALACPIRWAIAGVVGTTDILFILNVWQAADWIKKMKYSQGNMTYIALFFYTFIPSLCPYKAIFLGKSINDMIGSVCSYFFYKWLQTASKLQTIFLENSADKCIAAKWKTYSFSCCDCTFVLFSAGTCICNFFLTAWLTFKRCKMRNFSSWSLTFESRLRMLPMKHYITVCH